MDILGKYTDFIVTGLHLFFMLVLAILTVSFAAESYVKNVSTEYVDLCRTTGSIDAEEYQVFMNRITALGDYDVNLIHEPEMAYITSDAGEIEVSTTYGYKNTSDILAEMFPEDENMENKAYRMQNGDRLTIELKRGAANPIVTLSKIIYDISGIVILHYGGTVGYTN